MNVSIYNLYLKIQFSQKYHTWYTNADLFDINGLRVNDTYQHILTQKSGQSNIKNTSNVLSLTELTCQELNEVYHLLQK